MQVHPDGTKFTANREKNSEFFENGSKIVEFCPKSANPQAGAGN
jgi:hypothetical protein